MQNVLSNIIDAYECDFAKYPNAGEFPRISMIWKLIPSQQERENKKFIYKVVKEGTQASEYKDALQWLLDVRTVQKIYRSSAHSLPVAAYDLSIRVFVQSFLILTVTRSAVGNSCYNPQLQNCIKNYLLKPSGDIHFYISHRRSDFSVGAHLVWGNLLFYAERLL